MAIPAIAAISGLTQSTAGKVVAIGATILAGVAFYKIGQQVGWFKTAGRSGEGRDDKQARKEELTAIDRALQDLPVEPSFPMATYQSEVNKWAQYFDGCGSEFDKVFSALKGTKNDADILMLKKAWGRRRIKGCPWLLELDSLTQASRPELTLAEAFADEFSTSEQNEIAQLLRSKGIKEQI